MALANYDDLKTQIGNWTDDSSLTSYLSDHITLAESEIKDRLGIREMVTRAQAETSTTSRRIALPSGSLGDFVEMITIHFEEDPLSTLTHVSNEQINQFYTATAGRPAYFTIIGTELVTERFSDQAYTLEIQYYQFQALSDSNTTNSILTKYPDLYLYESVKQAAIFTHDDELKVKCERLLDGTPGNPHDNGIYGRIKNAEYRANNSQSKMYVIPRARTP